MTNPQDNFIQEAVERFRKLDFVGYSTGCIDSVDFDKVENFIRSTLEAQKSHIKETHAREVNKILNKHSKSTSEGGLNYVLAFEEMEKYEHKLFSELGRLPSIDK